MKTGDVFQLSREQYSDYSVGEGLRALKDFDFDAVWCEWIDAAKARAGSEDAYFWAGDAVEGFIDHALALGLVERFPIAELWIGGYGQFERSPEANLAQRRAQSAGAGNANG